LKASIDALSFAVLNARQINGELFSMSGLKISIIAELCKRNYQIISCVDNDEAGIKFNLKISNDARFSPNIILNDDCSKAKVKDFNELLKKAGTYFSINNITTDQIKNLKYDDLLQKLGKFRPPKNITLPIHNDHTEQI
jgi:hypothetical protein